MSGAQQGGWQGHRGEQESWARGGHVEAMQGGLCIAAGWAPPPQTVLEPPHPHALGPPGARTGHTYWDACGWAGQGAGRAQGRPQWMGAAQKNLRDPSCARAEQPRGQLASLAQQAHPPGLQRLRPPSLQAAGAAGVAGRAELSGPAVLSGKEMSKSRGRGREGEEQDSRAPRGTGANALPPPPAAARHLLPLPQFPQRGTAAPPGPGGGTGGSEARPYCHACLGVRGGTGWGPERASQTGDCSACSPAGSGARSASVITRVGCHGGPPAPGRCGGCCIPPLPPEQDPPRTHMSTATLLPASCRRAGLSCAKPSCAVPCQVVLCRAGPGGTTLC